MGLQVAPIPRSDLNGLAFLFAREEVDETPRSKRARAEKVLTAYPQCRRGVRLTASPPKQHHPSREAGMAAEPRWRCHVDGDSPYHVWPIDDLIEHDTSDDDGDCACGPTVEPVQGHDGYIGWLITHHSLDGREANE